MNKITMEIRDLIVIKKRFTFGQWRHKQISVASTNNATFSLLVFFCVWCVGTPICGYLQFHCLASVIIYMLPAHSNRLAGWNYQRWSQTQQDTGPIWNGISNRIHNTPFRNTLNSAGKWPNGVVFYQVDNSLGMIEPTVCCRWWLIIQSMYRCDDTMLQ